MRRGRPRPPIELFNEERMTLTQWTTRPKTAGNVVERWFAALTDNQIKCGTHRRTRKLEDSFRQYRDVNNEKPNLFVWTKTADQTFAAIERYFGPRSPDLPRMHAATSHTQRS